MSNTTYKQAVREQFGASAEAYVTSRVHRDQADLDRMIALAGPHGDELVLDIATGGGHTALAFAPHVCEVIASDLTQAMIDAAARYVGAQGARNVSFELADAEALPWPDHTFDIVTCRTAPHHFADVRRFVHESARVLRPGGTFVLVDTIAPADSDLDAFINAVEVLRDPTHARGYTLDEWRAFCQAAGLVVEHAEASVKAIAFDEWCDRARVDMATRQELQQRLAAASPAAKTVFQIEVVDGGVRSFVLHAGLIVARRPAH